MEYLKYPMKNMNITQGINGNYSHQGTNAIDDGGLNTGIEPLYAPCTMKNVARDTKDNGNAIWFESTEKVLFADGTVDYCTMMFIHDDYIGDIMPGRVFKQVEEFGDEGTAGQATGNHSHIEVAKGKFTDMYVKKVNYQLPYSIPPYEAFFINDVNVINGNGYNWKTYQADGWKQDSGCWYYYKKGIMCRGWHFLPAMNGYEDGQYYFNPLNGILQTNQYIIDEKGKWWVDSKGKWNGKKY